MWLIRSYRDRISFPGGPILVQRRRNADVCALVAELKGCTSLQSVKCLHESTIANGLDSNVRVANTLIHVYAKCGSLRDAHKVFDDMKIRTVVSWTALILGHAYNGDPNTALYLFSQMTSEGRAPNERTFLAAIKACTDLAVIEDGNEISCRGNAVNLLATQSGYDHDLYIKNALVHMYAKCGSMYEARVVFESITEPDLVSWNALILGYADNGEGEVALTLFSRMRREGCSPDSRTFVAILKVCTDFGKEENNVRVASRVRGRALQFLTSRSGFDSDVYVRSALVGMYAKCGSMVDARRVFDGGSPSNDLSWNIMIMGYAENGEGETALDMFSGMNSEGCEPDSGTLVATLKACIELVVKDEGNSNLDIVELKKKGKLLHCLASRNSCDLDPYVVNTLMAVYAKCGSMEDALELFDSVKDHTSVSWGTLVFGYADNGLSKTALDLLSRMWSEGCEPDARTFVAAIKACTDLAVTETGNCRGKALHILSSRSGCDSDTYVRGTLVDMYAKSGIMEDALLVFDCKHNSDVVAWNALIMGYADNGEGNMALDMFSAMRRRGSVPDARTFLAALKACIDLVEKEAGTTIEATTGRGKALHLLISTCGCDSDIFVKGTLVDMYGKCGNMTDALVLFKSIKNPNVVFWTALILGYADCGEGEVALDFFSRMTREGCAPNERTFVAAAKACTDVAGKEEKLKVASRQRARAVHLLALKTGCDVDIFVKNTLLGMYSKCGCMEDAQRVMESIKNPDVVSWNALISGFADNGESETALGFFSRMRNVAPDKRTFVAALKACTDLVVKEVGNGKLSNTASRLKSGKTLHMLAQRNGCESDIYVQSTLVDMYAKAGFMELARNVFDGVENRNLVSWTALILGYAENGEGYTALDLFARMKREGFVPDERTFVAALRGCTVTGALEVGKKLHAEICSRGLQNGAIIANCLVDFYAKCGNLAEAQKVFFSQPIRNLVTWTTLMAGHSRCGNSEAVFDVFDKMLDVGLLPNGVTFLCLLSACNHAGLVDKGKDYFKDMLTVYGIQPGLEHYSCMIDILGRANKLDAAMVLLRDMRFNPDVVTWTSILGACRKWGNVELGKLAFDSLGEKRSGAYVLIANTGEEA